VLVLVVDSGGFQGDIDSGGLCIALTETDPISTAPRELRRELETETMSTIIN
jgi:hypothetical protein